MEKLKVYINLLSVLLYDISQFSLLRAGKPCGQVKV